MKEEKPLTLKEIQQLIKELNTLDLDRADYGKIRDLVAKMKIGRSFLGLLIGGRPTYFFRGVNRKLKPTRVEELSYPPTDKVINFQRANPPGKPMFYCGEEPRVPFFEINIEPGDRVYLSKWSVRQKFAAISVEFGKNDNETDTIVKTYFQTKFSQRIHEVFSSDYKITSAIAESLSAGSVTGERFDIGAIIYPSVSMPARSENIAIRPEVVDSCLQLDYVKEYLVEKVNDADIKIDEHDFTNEFSKGNIQWKGRPGYYAILKDKGDFIQATSSTFGWLIRDRNGNIIDPV